MKIRKVIDISVKSGCIDLRDGVDCQWIGDGNAFYSFWGLPQLNADNVCAMYDIPTECVNMIHERGAAPYLLCEDYSGEVACERDALASRYCPEGLVAFAAADGLLFIQHKYLTPFEKGEELFFFERGGYIAVKVGITLRAVIAPYRVLDKEYIDGLSDYLIKCKLTAYNRGESFVQLGVED